MIDMASSLLQNACHSEEREDSRNSARLTCQLCSKPYREPRILPCLHSFCGQCLQMEIERSETKQNVKCPTCQRSIIAKGGVNDIPQNLHLGFEVEVAGYMFKIGSEGERSCDACIDGSMGSAVAFCCTCHHLLCKLCHDYHKHSKIFHHHQLVGLDNDSIKLLPSLMKPTENFCSDPLHDKDKFKFFCETCQLRICSDCTLLHKDHRINNIHHIAKVHRDAMKEALLCAQEVISKLTRAIDATSKITEQIEISRKNATLIITQAIEQLHQTIEERKKALLSEIEAISLSKNTALTLHKEQLIKKQEEIEYYKEMASHILTTHTDHETIALGDLLPTELMATLKKAENMPLTPNQSDIHVSLLHIDSLIKELSVFGHVVDSPPSPSQSKLSFASVAKVKEVYCVKVETMTSKGGRYPYGGLQVKTELKPKSHDGAVIPGVVEDHGDGTYTITITPQTTGPHQLLVTMDGQHIQNSPCDLDVQWTYKILCNPEQVIKCRSAPSGIAIHSNGNIYVSYYDVNSICVFDQAGMQKRIIGSSGNGDGQFDRPHGLFIKGDVIYVADSHNHRIQKLTTEGQLLKKFGQFGSGQGQFQNPKSVIVDQSDRLIVSDHDNHRVVVLHQAGTWLLTINGDTNGFQAFQNPYGLALDPQGNIHVSAYNSNAVKVFTPKGTYVKSYGDLNHPSGIVIDEKGYSLVNEFKGNCFTIFDPQGNKIHTISNIKSPEYIIIDLKSSGLYVSNYNDKTVLKYCVPM